MSIRSVLGWLQFLVVAALCFAGADALAHLPAPTATIVLLPLVAGRQAVTPFRVL
ncbi:hypothetical protein [Hymenobacter rigui]|uniref:hypothetical protein n=1 Tax=Hymenobacter rigui TaxID=334424 RepID=UPI0014774AB3|nr:hypothetical protein [Hymenobacter rigui]